MLARSHMQCPNQGMVQIETQSPLHHPTRRPSLRMTTGNGCSGRRSADRVIVRSRVNGRRARQLLAQGAALSQHP